MLMPNNIRVIEVEEHESGIWGGGKGTRGAHRNSKAKSVFLMVERKPESTITQIITIKRELDKAIQEIMKLSQIYCRHNISSNSVPAGSAYYYSESS